MNEYEDGHEGHCYCHCVCMYVCITEMQLLVSEAAAKITTPLQFTVVFCSDTSSMQWEKREKDIHGSSQ